MSWTHERVSHVFTRWSSSTEALDVVISQSVSGIDAFSSFTDDHAIGSCECEDAIGSIVSEIKEYRIKGFVYFSFIDMY